MTKVPFIYLIIPDIITFTVRRRNNNFEETIKKKENETEKETKIIKIGKSYVSGFGRLDAYGSGTEVLCVIGIREPNDLKVFEKIFIKAFEKHFERVDGKKEYFIGNPEEAIDLFYKTTHSCANRNEDLPFVPLHFERIPLPEFKKQHEEDKENTKKIKYKSYDEWSQHTNIVIQLDEDEKIRWRWRWNDIVDYYKIDITNNKWLKQKSKTLNVDINPQLLMKDIKKCCQSSA